MIMYIRTLIMRKIAREREEQQQQQLEEFHRNEVQGCNTRSEHAYVVCIRLYLEGGILSFFFMELNYLIGN